MAALLAAVLLPSAMLGGALDSAAQQEQVDRWASNAKGFFAGAVLLHFILGATIIKHAIGARNLDSAVATAAPTASGRCRWHSDRLKLRLLDGRVLALPFGPGCTLYSPRKIRRRLARMWSVIAGERAVRRAANGAAFVAATMSGWAAGLAQWRRREYNRHWRTVTLGTNASRY